MRILGLDFGSRTCGVAVSDELMLTAQGLTIIRRERENKLRKTLAQIESIIEEYRVERIVLGLPKNMDNSEGERAAVTREFAEMLYRRTNMEIILWDERLTTVSADRIMIEAGLSRAVRHKQVDKIAATYILQGYLDSLERGEL